MAAASTEYEEVVSAYIGLVRQESVQAAVALERIHVKVGARAALRSALIITIFRMELKQKQWIPDMSVYAYLIRDYPQAVPLLEYAMGCCLQVWGIGDLQLAHLTMSDPANSGAQAASNTS